MGKLLELTGKRFNHWTVIRRVGVTPNKQQIKWLCRCDCGIERLVTGANLKNNSSKSCGCTWKQDDLVGRVFGKLKVVSPTGFVGKYWTWLVRCDCGIEKVIRGGNLLHGNIRSCGCLRISGAMKARGEKELLPSGEAVRRYLIRQYKAGARARHLEWKLLNGVFLKLTEMPCHYCGQPPSNKIKRFQDDFTYSGIDRKDNDSGYIDDNVVPCCKVCNKMKGTLTHEQFLTHTYKIQQNC